MIQTGPVTYLSCDDLDDAIRSLALFYNVSPDVVRGKYEHNWPKEFSKNVSPEAFKHDFFVWGMGRHLGSSTENRDVTACFYHRSRFDGASQWFSKGILNNAEGAKAFFEKLKLFSDDQESLTTAQNVAASQIFNRDNCSKVPGPHAFFSRDEAVNGLGRNFEVPEFFTDPIWDTHKKAKNTALNICMTKLQPVIVKFCVPQVDINGYIASLWHYLHHHKFKRSSFYQAINGYMGNGHAIPPEHIIELISEF